jgi:hypothetical protein
MEGRCISVHMVALLKIEGCSISVHIVYRNHFFTKNDNINGCTPCFPQMASEKEMTAKPKAKMILVTDLGMCQYCTKLLSYKSRIDSKDFPYEVEWVTTSIDESEDKKYGRPRIYIVHPTTNKKLMLSISGLRYELIEHLLSSQPVLPSTNAQVEICLQRMRDFISDK